MRALVLIALIPLAASAQKDSAQKKDTVIVFHGDLGYVATTGNTQVSTFNAADGLEIRTSPVNKIDQLFSVVYGQNKNKVQTSIWTAGVRDAYSFTKQIALYGLVGFDRNTFAGVTYDFQEGAGVAITPIMPKNHSLEIDGGFSYVEQKLLPDSTDDHAAARVAIAYKYTFAKTAYVQELIEGLPDLHQEKDFRLNDETDVVAPLSRHLALKLGYVIRYANLPPPGFKTTDRLFTSDLQVTF